MNDGNVNGAVHIPPIQIQQNQIYDEFVDINFDEFDQDFDTNENLEESQGHPTFIQGNIDNEEIQVHQTFLQGNNDIEEIQNNNISSHVVEHPEEILLKGGVSECLAEIPQIIENYKKEKVIKENVKNMIYDEAIELEGISLDTYIEENNQNVELVEKNIYVHNILNHNIAFDEVYDEEMEVD